ncbi:MAG: hypothetical protein P4M12_00485 [Gammaproteobacteria bacterium]|nr:hypothetical protein [Gammaproteobacteria bacterium]
MRGTSYFRRKISLLLKVFILLNGIVFFDACFAFPTDSTASTYPLHPQNTGCPSSSVTSAVNNIPATSYGSPVNGYITTIADSNHGGSLCPGTYFVSWTFSINPNNSCGGGWTECSMSVRMDALDPVSLQFAATLATSGMTRDDYYDMLWGKSKTISVLWNSTTSVLGIYVYLENGNYNASTVTIKRQ